MVLLERCYASGHIEAAVRPALQERLGAALSNEDGVAAAEALQALLDTWPVAALVDASVKLWTERAAAAVVPVLARAADLLCLAHGWGRVGAGPWPLPDQEWIRAQVPEGSSVVLRRSSEDGADAVAEALGLPITDRAWALPAVAQVSVDELVARRAELARQLVHAEVAAVSIEGVLPDGPEAALAMGEIRMEALAQRAFERFGVAGLLAPKAPQWSQLLRPAPPGQSGTRLSQACDTAILPGPPAALVEGTARPVGWLLWRGPHAPVAVQAEAVAILSEMDGQRDLESIAATLGAPEPAVREIADQLVQLGAATA
jgi:hypothetical protein